VKLRSRHLITRGGHAREGGAAPPGLRVDFRIALSGACAAAEVDGVLGSARERGPAILDSATDVGRSSATPWITQASMRIPLYSSLCSTSAGYADEALKP
jgi:hypothetical protein